jgi:hypothetical protein
MAPEQTGLGVDAQGDPVPDPTANVLALVSAANRRQDDLREAESSHVREVAAIRAQHTKEMREAEAARLDAIREVDRAAVQESANVLASQATALAATVNTAAEAMRASVAAAAAVQETSQAQALTPITAAIEDLRRAQYEAQGQRAQVVDRRAGSGSLGMWIGVAVGVLGLFVSMVAVGVTLFVVLGS